MKSPVLIKSNKYGMTLHFDQDPPFDLLKEQVYEKLHAFTHFFNHASMAVTFEGRAFTEEEERAMAATIEEAAGIQILYLTGTEEDTQKTHRKTCNLAEARTKQRMETDTEDGLFCRGNLKGRTILETDKNIVVVGDIGTDAIVISKGNVVVIGSIYGTVIAGAAGDYNTLIAAIDMKPKLLRIGEIEVKPVIGGSYSWARLL